MDPQATTAPAPRAGGPRAGGPPKRSRAAGAVLWTARLGLALFLFIGALQIMKTGAASLDILRSGSWLVKNAGSTLGLGWLGALLVLSGSPIAASALALVKGGAISELEGFTMLTGSRLGAAFVVLLVAVLYALRSTGAGGKVKPVSTAVLALSATALIYVPGSLIGYALLRWEPFRNLSPTFPAQFSDLIDLIYGGLLERISSWPPLLLFVGGLGILLLSFRLIDTVLPELSEETIESSRMDWLKSKWPMFALGCGVALVTMSVSVALTVLVPLNAKGYVKREAMLPYIMGANITTLGDTLLAALVLGSAAAVRIVLAGIVGTTIVSLILLAFFYEPVRKGVWKFQKAMVLSKPRLAGFTAALFLVPIATIAISGVTG